MPVPYAYSLEELKERLNECIVAYKTTSQKFEEAKENKEIKHQHLADVTQKYENITKKIEKKTQERELLTEKITDQQSERQQIQQQIPQLTKKYAQLNEDIQKCQEKLNLLTKTQPKVKSYITSPSPISQFF
jgi:chromosome segregation ATPase